MRSSGKMSLNDIVSAVCDFGVVRQGDNGYLLQAVTVFQNLVLLRLLLEGQKKRGDQIFLAFRSLALFELFGQICSNRFKNCFPNCCNAKPMEFLPFPTLFG